MFFAPFRDGEGCKSYIIACEETCAAAIIDPASGTTLTMREAVERLLERALPDARELGTEADLRILEQILDEGTEAECQLALLDELGDLQKLQLRLLELAREELGSICAQRGGGLDAG